MHDRGHAARRSGVETSGAKKPAPRVVPLGGVISRHGRDHVASIGPIGFDTKQPAAKPFTRRHNDRRPAARTAGPSRGTGRGNRGTTLSPRGPDGRPGEPPPPPPIRRPRHRDQKREHRVNCRGRPAGIAGNWSTQDGHDRREAADRHPVRTPSPVAAIQTAITNSGTSQGSRRRMPARASTRPPGGEQNGARRMGVPTSRSLQAVLHRSAGGARRASPRRPVGRRVIARREPSCGEVPDEPGGGRTRAASRIPPWRVQRAALPRMWKARVGVATATRV